MGHASAAVTPEASAAEQERPFSTSAQPALYCCESQAGSSAHSSWHCVVDADDLAVACHERHSDTLSCGHGGSTHGSSQVGATNPGGHSQLKPPRPSVQTPPFWHGSSQQSSYVKAQPRPQLLGQASAAQ